jgi:hypothetical protein
MIRDDWGVYAVSTLICLATSVTFHSTLSIIAGLNPAKFNIVLTAQGLAVQWVAQSITIFMLMCLVGIGVRHALGTWPKIPDLFLPFKQLNRSVLAVLVYMIPSALGDVLAYAASHVTASGPFTHVFAVYYWMAMLIPALIIGPMAMGLSAAMFSKMPILEAYREGFRRTGWPGILLSFVILLATILGASGFIGCCVGVIFTGPILSNVIALHYLYYFPPQQPEPEAITA